MRARHFLKIFEAKFCKIYKVRSFKAKSSPPGNALILLKELWARGYAAEDIIGQIMRIIKMHNNLTEDVQLGFMNACALTHLRIVSGCNSSILQISGLLGTFVNIVETYTVC